MFGARRGSAAWRIFDCLLSSRSLFYSLGPSWSNHPARWRIVCTSVAGSLRWLLPWYSWLSPIWPRRSVRTSDCSRWPSFRFWCASFRFRSRVRCRCRSRRLSRSRLPSSKNSRTTQVLIQRDTRSSFSRTRGTIRNLNNRNPANRATRCLLAFALASRRISRESRQLRSRLRRGIDNSASDRFFNAASSPFRITEVSSRNSRHSAPVFVSVIRTSITAATTTTIAGPTIAVPATTTSVARVSIIVTVPPRMWIALVVRQRIPANIRSEREVE